MTTFATAGLSPIDIPDEPDLARMRRETGARLRAAMKDQGVDALILLGNGNVVYATGASWPLLLKPVLASGPITAVPRTVIVAAEMATMRPSRW